MNNKLYVKWNEIHKLINKFVINFKNDVDDNVIKNMDIIAIARGGLIPATLISYQLGIPLVYSLGVSFYHTKNAKPRFYQKLSNPPKRYMLLVDDISDSGKTFQYVINYLCDNYKFDAYDSISDFSLYKKYNTNYDPLYCGKEIKTDKWVVFPWDKD